MFYYLKTTVRERWSLFLVVIIILSTLGLGFLGAQTVSEQIVVQAKTDLEKNWRYPYDLLVLPKPHEESTNILNDLIAPQSTIASYGGISKEDVESIRKMSGVEIAAPLSLIGYIPMEMVPAIYESADVENFYETKSITTTHDGLSAHIISESSYISDYGSTPYPPDDESAYSRLSNMRSEERNTFPPNSSFRYYNELLLVAIDPIEENRLFTFTDSLVLGNNLDSVPVKKIGSEDANLIPIVALANQQAVMNETLIISKIEIPEKVVESEYGDDVNSILESLPKIEVVNITLPMLSEEWKYKTVSRVTLLGGDKFKDNPHFGAVSSHAKLFRYSPIHYYSKQNENDNIPTVQPKMFEQSNAFHSQMSAAIPRYRTIVEDSTFYAMGYTIIDLYDSEKVVPVFNSSWQKGDPVDIYTPPNSRILEDGAGTPVLDKYLLPLPFKDTYYTGSPDAITTMEAADLFYKKDPISSIRVVVADVAERSDASQLKIEKIAKQIMDETGLHVEIMLGSAAAKVHVDLGNEEAGKPGLLEEGWQKAGVSWSIEKQIEKSNILLFIYLLLVSFIFCYTVITHSLLRRSTEFAMLRAIGWSRLKIINAILVEILALGFLSLIPIVLANAKWHVLPWYEIGYIVCIILPVIGLGYLTGSQKALKLSPRAGLEGEGTQWKFMRLFSIKGLFSYVVHQLMRRPLRFGLLAIVLALTSFMVILFIATQKSLSDFLLLSFLGETIDLNLKGFQTVFLVSGIILTVSIVFLLLYLNITERRSEFFILRSIGWTLQRIQLYMGIEAILIALTGSFIGGIGAYTLLTYFSSIWLPIWLLLSVILTPPTLILIFSMIIVQSLKMNRTNGGII